MALRLSEQRLRLVPDPPAEASGVPELSSSGEGGDDQSGGTPLPGREHGDEPGDFYADAMETV
jgi:hypothetical protein